MKTNVLLFVVLFLFPVCGKTQVDRDTSRHNIKVTDETVRAEYLADSAAKAELKKYQQQYPGRLNRAQLTLVAYDRTTYLKTKDYHMFDYDYNRPLRGLMYMLHFSVMVNLRTGRTVFKIIDDK